MPTITNKTKKPLRVPLPGGKKLHLGPGKSGQVAPKSLEHPPLEKMIAAGEIEVLDTATRGGEGVGEGDKGRGPGPGGGPRTGGIRHFGDR